MTKLTHNPDLIDDAIGYMITEVELFQVPTDTFGATNFYLKVGDDAKPKFIGTAKLALNLSRNDKLQGYIFNGKFFLSEHDIAVFIFDSLTIRR